MKNILVLGANGFIGHHLVNKLILNYNVIGYDKTIPEIKTANSFIKGNFFTEIDFEKILTSYQIDTVYHLISSTVPCEGTENIIKEISENIIPTIRLLEAIKNTGTEKIIFTSSGGTVYGESSGLPHLVTDTIKPICSYGVHKVVIEHYLNLYNHLYNINCFIARISNPYGVLELNNRTQGLIPIFINKLIHKEPITIFGESIRDYIHINDVIDALILIAQIDSKKRLFNIGTGISTSLIEIIEIIETITNRKFTKIIKKNIRSCDVHENILDISETIKELNWNSKITLKEGIKLTIEEMENIVSKY